MTLVMVKEWLEVHSLELIQQLALLGHWRTLDTLHRSIKILTVDKTQGMVILNLQRIRL